MTAGELLGRPEAILSERNRKRLVGPSLRHGERTISRHEIVG
jgi:hypothetical protein